MSDYYDNLLKERVKKRMRPLQYLLAHVFTMVATLIIMGAATEYNLVTEDAILVVSIAFVVSLIAHALWYANQTARQKIEAEELMKLRDVEKPKRERLALREDGELVDYDDYLEEEQKQVEYRR